MKLNNFNIIKSCSYSQDEILNWIIKLYCPNGFELDPTYSKGNFYKNIPQPKYKFDINPMFFYVLKGDCKNLPLKDNSINSVIFDPPFVIGGNNYKKYKKGSCIISKRFTAFTSWDELKNFYIESLKEFYRILKNNSYLIFKCQDVISSKIQYLSHIFVINKAIELGFYAKDIFILLAQRRILSGQVKKQQHARKYHSYFLVFVKNGRKVNYE